jgi:hypothetical protein
MTEIKSRYHSYLFRLWLEPGEAEATWRASLEDAHTGERRGFTSLEALFAFVLEQTGQLPTATIGDCFTRQKTPDAQ